MVIFTLDSGVARRAVLVGGRGMLEMIRSDIGPWLRVGGLPARRSLVNIVVNMSQMAAMVEGAYGAVGLLPPPAGHAAGLRRRRRSRSPARTVMLGGARRLQARREDHDVRCSSSSWSASSSSPTKGLLDWQHVAGARPRPGAAHSARSVPVVGSDRVARRRSRR